MATEQPAAETPDKRAQLAIAVRDRRLALGLSARAAADAAGVARGTWISLEDGTRRTLESNHAGIENALRWAPGSIRQILEGGHPSDAETVNPATFKAEGGLTGAATTNTNGNDEALIRVMRSDMDDATKAKIMRLLIGEQQRYERERLARVDELIEAFRNAE